MLERTAAAAWTRPWAFLAAAAGVLGALLALAWGVPGELGHGPPSAGEPKRPDLVLSMRAAPGLDPQVSAVALDAIEANLEADPDVGAVLRDRSRGPRRAVMEIRLSEDDAGEHRAIAKRLEAGIDPGPLEVSAGGRIATLEEAEALAGDDLWRLELLVAPLALLALLAALGPRLALGPPACAAIAIAGSLAGLRLAGALGDPSALAIVPAAALGLALGIELPALLAARWEDEASLAGPAEALRRTVAEGAGPLAFAGAAAALAAGGMLATSYGPATSIVLGCALATAWALVGCALVMPPLMALSARRDGAGEGRGLRERDRRLAALLSGLPRLLARGRLRVALGAALALAISLALAYPALDATSEALKPGDLPAGSPAAEVDTEAAAQAGVEPAATAAAGDSLVAQLPFAAALAGGLLAIAFGLRSRSLRAGPAAVAALLPAAAACGAVTLVFGEDELVRLSVGEPGSISPGALASAVAALTSVAAARTAASLDAVRSERGLDPGPPGVAERAAGLVMPAAAVGTLIAGAAAGTLIAIELDAARELGLALAAGLLVDLLVVRPPALAAMAHWGESRGGRGAGARRLSLRWPRWRRRADQTESRVEGSTASPS